MGQIHRRRFLQGAVAATTAAAFGGPFQGFTGLTQGVAAKKPNFDTLGPVADLRDGKIRLHLPDGFQYRSFHDTDTAAFPPPPATPTIPALPPVILTDGTVLQGRHDGMGAFPGPNGNVILVRNHEINGPGAAFGPPPTTPPTTPTPYDAQTRSGTTTIEVTPHGEVVNAFTSLNGTQMNCSGGRMPWGSWVTCEETINGPDVGPDFTLASNVTLQKPHGFIFEVPAGGQSNRQPITQAGRFAHEAVAFDPKGGILYLTEDNFGFPSGFYRYIPATNPMETGHLDNAGQLQMARVVGQPNAHLEGQQTVGASYAIDWVDIDDPNPLFPFTPGETAPTTNNQAIVYVGDQGRAQGAAGFSRLEGAVYDRGSVFFTSTQGGGTPMSGPDTVLGYGRGTGQVWGYDPKKNRLEVVYQSPGANTLDFPDNVTVSQRGTLILCEDNVNDNFIRGLSKQGDLFNIALDRMTNRGGASRSNDEFAGSTFSPDGETLFVNIQAGAGITFAIWGNWGKLGV